MKKCSRCEEIKSLECFHPNKGGKFGRYSVCKECKAVYTKTYQAKPEVKERRNEQMRCYRDSNREHVRALERDRYWLDPEKSREKYRAKDPAPKREASRRFRKRNPEKVANDTYRRRLAKQQATPKWVKDELSMFLFKEIYHLRDLRTKATGIEHNVDHIVPLRAEKVCGLHVPNNLRVITALENQAKAHKWNGSMQKLL
jgi:hypothetical protein